MMRKMFAVFVVVACVGFAPMAAEFGFVTLQGKTPTYASLLEVLLGWDFAFGPESGMATLPAHWMSMHGGLQLVLGTHALLASVAMLLCLPLVHPRTRSRSPVLHRRLGLFTAGLSLVTMLLAAIYLWFTPMEKIFGGAPFALGLWGAAFLSVWSVVAGVAEARRRDFDAHRAWMILFFGTLLIAPALRLWWVLFGFALGDGPHAHQGTAHVLALMVLGPQTPVGAIAYMALQKRGGEVERPRWVLASRVGLGLLALGWGQQTWLAWQALDPGVLLDWGVLGASGVMMVMAALFFGLAGRRPVEMAVHGVALATVPVLLVGIEWAAVAGGLPAADAWLSAAMLAPAFALGTSYNATVYRTGLLERVSAVPGVEGGVLHLPGGATVR